MASPPAETLHLRLPPPLKPTGGVRKRGHPPGRIAQYDSEIVHYNNQRYLPSHIAELLCQEHGLDPQMMNRKTVERRLQTIKTKGLVALAPVNEDADLLARDTAKNCLLVCFFVLFLIIVCRAAVSYGCWRHPNR